MSSQRLLIWGKTYPELSESYKETVCTGGCAEDGTPIRIYPVPLRYLPRHNQYKLYSWIEVPIEPSTRDRRPESHRIKSEQLRVVDWLDTDRGWMDRRRVIFRDTSWHYQCLEDLKLRQQESKNSMGLVGVSDVEWVKLEERPADDRHRHEAKLLRLKSKLDLFGGEQRDLAFYPYKIRIKWYCERNSGPQRCPGHTAVVMDWGLGQMGRRDGPDMAVRRMEDLADVSKYDLRLYVGNFKAHPRNFGIVGLWYPLRREVERHPLQEDLFM